MKSPAFVHHNSTQTVRANGFSSPRQLRQSANSVVPKALQAAASIFIYCLRIVYLITKSDLKTVVLPCSVFSIVNVLASPALTNDPSPGLTKTFCQVPRVVLYVWLLVFIFDLSNQRLPHSVLEDKINKPYRPIASGELSEKAAGHLLRWAIPAVFLLNLRWLGGAEEYVAWLMLTWLHNDKGHGDLWWKRNALVALGYTAANMGGTRLVRNAALSKKTIGSAGLVPIFALLDSSTWTLDHSFGTDSIWFLITGAVILTTTHVQDMPDQVGDALRGRKTMPLLFGDALTRRVTSIGVIFWTLTCSAFWVYRGLGVLGSLPTAILGLAVAIRSVIYKEAAEDRVTYAVYCLWLGLLYVLPLLSCADAPTVF